MILINRNFIIWSFVVLFFCLVRIDAIISMHYPSRLLSYWSPTNIVVSPINKHIFITDMSFNRVLHLSSEAVYISTVSLPTNQSMFLSPIKMAVDLDGYLYIAAGADKSFAMIYKYRTTDDQLIGNISLPFYVPAALTIAPIDGNIYIATTDINDTAVYILNNSGEKLNKFNASNFLPPLGRPTALTMDKTAERLYIADRNEQPTGRVYMVNSQTGKQLKSYTDINIYRPTGVVVDDNLNVYIADMATNCIAALMSNGTLIRTYTNSLYSPQGLTFSSNGNLLLSDTLDNRMVLFDISTAIVLKVYSSSDPLLIAPRLVTVHSNGDIYVNSLNDNGAYNILKKLTITNSSANITQIIDPKPHFGFPVGLTLNNNGSIYVTDADIPYGYIHIFAPNGTETSRIYTSNPSMRSPYGISIDLLGNLYVVDSGNNRVIKLLRNGTIVQSYKTTPPLQFPYDVKIRNDGVIYISDIRCSCIYQLTNDGKQIAVIQLQEKPYLIRPFITLLPVTGSNEPDILLTITYPSPQVNHYTSNGTLIAIYTIPASASTGWDPYASAIDEKNHYLIVAESGGRIMFFDL